MNSARGVGPKKRKKTQNVKHKMHKLSKRSLRAIHTSLCKTLQNTKNNKFYIFCPINLPHQSNQSCLNIQSCYSNCVYLYGYFSFAFYILLFFSLSTDLISLSLSLSLCLSLSLSLSRHFPFTLFPSLSSLSTSLDMLSSKHNISAHTHHQILQL